eukprot:scaffold17542_cov146-Isochrysis_galbana.AAC.2
MNKGDLQRPLPIRPHANLHSRLCGEERRELLPSAPPPIYFCLVPDAETTPCGRAFRLLADATRKARFLRGLLGLLDERLRHAPQRLARSVRDQGRHGVRGAVGEEAATELGARGHAAVDGGGGTLREGRRGRLVVGAFGVGAVCMHVCVRRCSGSEVERDFQLPEPRFDCLHSSPPPYSCAIPCAPSQLVEVASLVFFQPSRLLTPHPPPRRRHPLSLRPA